jgi:hypothetical protein
MIKSIRGSADLEVFMFSSHSPIGLLHFTLATVLALTAAAGDGKGVVARAAMDSVVRAVESRMAANPNFNADYLGSEVCMACHREYAADFRNSLHHNGLKHVPDDKYTLKDRWGVIADYDKNGVDDFKQGLDFNKISSVFNVYKPNAPVLGYKPGVGYIIAIGPMEYVVAVAHGGSGAYKQRYLVRLPAVDRPNGLSADYYYSPVQFNEVSRSYVLYSPQYWYNADNTPKITGPLTASQAAKVGKSFNKDCVGCHAVNFAVKKDANGEYVSETALLVYAPPGDPHYLDMADAGAPGSINSGCERCHGPGLKHVLRYGDSKSIILPSRLTAMQQNELCGSCHNRGTSSKGAHEYPLDEDSGEDYSRHIGKPLIGKFFVEKPGLWPDGRTSRQHHQQMWELKQSSKWEFQFHKVTCSDCHDVHRNSAGKHMKQVMEVDGASGKLKLNVKVEDNSLCLGCHAGFGPFATLKREDIANMEKNREIIARVVSDHSKHPYSPESAIGLSRCTECHMAKMAASGDAYDMHSHTFEVVAPEKTIKYQAQGGMPNSCAVRCHRPLAPAIGLPADSSLTNWTEPSDKELAQWLMKFYGPEGVWWKTAHQ